MEGKNTTTKLLEENLEISKESLNILKKMHRAQKIGRMFTVLYWMIILGGLVGVYYYVQPVIINIMETWQKIAGDISSVAKVSKALDPDNLPVNNISIPMDIFNKVQNFFKN